MRINPQILSEAAKSFDLELSSLHPLGGMEGMALEYRLDGGDYVLKVTPRDKSNPDQVAQIEAKTRFIRYLAENGVRVARPVLSPHGNWLETIEKDDAIYVVTAATKAEGVHIDLYNPTQSKPGLFQAWGRVTGKMHRLAKTYQPWRKDPGDEGVPSPITNWKQEHEFFRNWCQFDEVRAKWVALGIEIGALPQTREGYGLIHNDLHPWNFLVNAGGEITVIDFDVCTYHFFAKDIAIALFFANWVGNPGKGRSKDDYLTSFFQNYMRGYSTENTLADFWYRKLPIFLKHHQILLFTVFTDEWKTPNKWQLNTLQKWKRQILTDIPVVKMQF
jgi:Ser/Thr protein kinase RdoA (MazF antagonist)